MAIFRNVNMSFWTDPKVVDDYTPEDRYFMLYALTNNYTNIIGCYEISIKQMSNDLGYTKDVVENLLKRFMEVHHTINYDFDTKELMVINWHKYNWSSSPKLDNPLYTTIESVKSDLFHDELAAIYNNRETVKDNENMVLIPYRYGIDTTITNTIPITVSKSINNNVNNKLSKEQLKEEFEILWKMYPNKQGKTKSLDKYIKIRTKDNVEYNAILDGLKRYLIYCEQNKDWYKPKNGSTWFNQESWNDEYPSNTNNSNNYKQPVRKEVVPEWINKQVKDESVEDKELTDIVNSFDPEFEARRKALQERLREKYKKK